MAELKWRRSRSRSHQRAEELGGEWVLSSDDETERGSLPSANGPLSEAVRQTVVKRKENGNLAQQLGLRGSELFYTRNWGWKMRVRRQPSGGKKGPSRMRKQTSLILEACRGGGTLQGEFNFSGSQEVKEHSKK